MGRKKIDFENPDWRLENIYSIVDKQSRLIKFKRNPIQKLLSNLIGRRNYILKSRQVGISTHEILRMFDHTIFHENFTSCILAHERDGLAKLFRIPTRAYTGLKGISRPRLDRGGGSRYEMYFPDINSRIYTSLESRSDTINWLHISEAAFVKDPFKILATTETVPEDGIITMETTANGMGNHFFDWWNDLTKNFNRIFFPWYLMPEYKVQTGKIQYTGEEKKLIKQANKKYSVKITKEQIAFRREKISNLKDMFFQEYAEDEQTCFLTSGGAAISAKAVQEHLTLVKSAISEKDYIKIFQYPIAGHSYVIGCDTSEGVGGDYSVACVIDTKTLEQVATLRGQFKPYDFAERIIELAETFRTRGQMPLVAVERNNHGHAVLLKLDDQSYPNIYINEDDDRPGWLSNKVTRPIMMDAVVDAVENFNVTINDRITLGECLTLVDNGGKIEAATGKHDDCVIAFGIALQMCLNFGTLDIYEDLKSKIRI